MLRSMIPPKLAKAPLINVKSGHPLQRVAIDIVGLTPRSSSGHEWLLVVSDHFTKFAQAFPVRNTSAETLAKKMKDEYICRFRCFESLRSDQGANVDGAVFHGLCDLIWGGQDMENTISPPGGWTGGEAEQIACEDLVQVDIGTSPRLGGLRSKGCLGLQYQRPRVNRLHSLSSNVWPGSNPALGCCPKS